MTAHLSVADLLDHADDPAVRDHLTSCPSCRARARLVDSLDREPPIDDDALAAARSRASLDLARTLTGGARPDDEDDDLEPGRILDRYRVEARLGAGGMGTVYRVRHTELGSLHGLKVLRGRSREERQRLMREGRAQGGLRHPNVVRVTDVIEVDGCPALVLELVDGPTLAERLRDGPPLSPADVDMIAAGVLRGVAAAHRAGLVHRDLKPGNILLAEADGVLVPKVSDFGLARPTVDDDTAITRSQSPMGTPAYMAPEQIRDASRASARSDVFSLGAVLYELITGRRAFEGRSVVDVYDQIRAGTIPPIFDVSPGAPARWSDAVTRALAVDPAARFEDASALLAAWLGERAAAPAPRSRLGRWAAALGLAGAAAATALALAWGTRPDATPARPAATDPTDDRRLTARPNALQVFAVAVSPDGREIAYSDSRGLTRQAIDGDAIVTVEGGPWHDLDYFPDGQHLLLHGTRDGVAGVWRTALDGTGAELLYQGAADYVRLAPDGQRFALADASGLWVHRLDDGTRARIRPIGATDTTAALAWSPSGRTLATVHRASSGDAWLELTAVDGTSTRRLLTDSRLITYALATVAWLPDDRLIYGLSRDDEVTWMALDGAESATDAAAAVAIRKFSGFAVTQVRASPDGRRVVYIRMAGKGVPHVLGRDAVEARRLGDEDWDEVPLGWADDDHLLLGSSRLGGTIVRRGLGDGPADVVMDEPRWPKRVDRVGEDLVYLAPQKGREKVDVVRARGGEPTTVVTVPGPPDTFAMRCRARCLIGERASGVLRFSWVDLDAGVLTPAGLEVPLRARGAAWDLAPDGHRVAVAAPEGVMVHDLATGAVAVWPLQLESPTEVAWGQGDRLYVSGLTYDADAYKIIEVTPTASRPRWSSMAWYLFRLAPSPDDETLAFAAFTFDDDLWLAEGLTP